MYLAELENYHQCNHYMENIDLWVMLDDGGGICYIMIPMCSAPPILGHPYVSASLYCAALQTMLLL